MVSLSALNEQGVRLRQIAIQEILPGTKDRDDLAQVKAVFDWVKKSIRYIEDPVSLDFYPSALVLYSLGGGDCDDHVVFICSVLAVIGFTVGCKVIHADTGEWHIYPLVWLPKNAPEGPMALDTTWPGAKNAGDEFPPERCSYSRSWIFNFGG